MRILITSNSHPYYNRVGEIVGRTEKRYSVRIPGRRGTILTLVSEGQFKLVSIQEADDE